MSSLIFISAQNEDSQYAEQIYRFLRSEGLAVFFSKESLPELGSSDYRKQIDNALDDAQHMIVVTSSRANVTSKWVEAEWGLFINEKRSGRKLGNLITVVAGGLKPAELPASLRYYEVIPFGAEEFQKILRYVMSPRDEISQPSRFGEIEVTKEVVRPPNAPALLGGATGAKPAEDTQRVTQAVKANAVPAVMAGAEASVRRSPERHLVLLVRGIRTHAWKYLGVAALLALAVIGVIDGKQCQLAREGFSDDFENLEKWANHSGWLLEKASPANQSGRAYLERSPELGFARGKCFGNLRMSFNLKLVNGAGAAWALRVQENPKEYFLFYLSASESKFYTYLVEGKNLYQQRDAEKVLTQLKAGCSYTVRVLLSNAQITHTITALDTDPNEQGFERDLGKFSGADKLPMRGSIGFRTVNSEAFSVGKIVVDSLD